MNGFQYYSESEVKDVMVSGSIPVTFDIFNNIRLSLDRRTISQSVISVPLFNYEYNESYIKKLYDVKFSELPTASAMLSTASLETTQSVQNIDVIDLLNQTTMENAELRDQLTTLLEDYDSLYQSSNQDALFEIITSLRIRLGEGKSITDFEPTFPFNPISFEVI